MTGGSESLLSWVFKLVNFGILVAVLVKFAGKPLKNYVISRHKAVKDRVDEAARKLEEAETLRKEYEEKLEGLDAEIAEFRKTMIEQAEREKTRILKEAEALAARIKQQAVLTYEQESRESLTRIRSEIARLTVERAEAIVRERMTKEDHNLMVEDFIEKLRSLN